MGTKKMDINCKNGPQFGTVYRRNINVALPMKFEINFKKKKQHLKNNK
jgi:hypothetical protein